MCIAWRFSTYLPNQAILFFYHINKGGGSMRKKSSMLMNITMQGKTKGNMKMKFNATRYDLDSDPI
jgi:hypothetical protein